MDDKERSLDDFMPPKKNNLRRRAVQLVGVLVLIVAVGLIAVRAGFDQSLIRHQLDEFATQLKTKGEAEGRIIEFTYGDIEMAGGITDRFAIVHEPKLLVKPQDAPPPLPGKPNALLITSPIMEIRSQPGNATALRIALPQPVDVAGEEAPAKSLLRIAGNTPLTLDFTQKEEAGVKRTQWQQALPSEIRLTYLHQQQAEGLEDATPVIVPVYKTIVLNSSKAEGQVALAEDGSGAGDATLELRDVSIMPENMPEGTIKVGVVQGMWRNHVDEKKTSHMESNFHIDAITAAPEILPYAPISFAFDATQESAPPENPQQMMAQSVVKYQLKTFDLRMKDASVKATADFASSPGDLVPVGKASLNVANLPFIVAELKDLGLLGESNEMLAAALIERISGTPYGEVTNLDVAIDRPAGGAFTIGKATFEELFTVVLQSKLQEFKGGNVDIVAPPPPAPAATTEKNDSKT